MPDPLISILNKLKYAGMLEESIGFQEGVGRSRKAFQTRYSPTAELLPYLNDIPDSAVKPLKQIEQEIILRSKVYSTNRHGQVVTKTKYHSIEMDSDNRNRIDWVRFINSNYARHHIDIFRPHEPRFDEMQGESIQESEININLNKKYLYRIFNDNFQKGGRFYGAWWQNIPSELRRYITIDTHPTVEIDFRGIHIALLYALNGIDYYSQGQYMDPYTIEGWNRDDVKLLLQIVLNTSRRNVIPAYIDAMRDKNLEPYPSEQLEELIAKFEEVHVPIKEYFYQGLGVHLQYLDAVIAQDVLMNCMQIGERNASGFIKKFLALPVHDSFIVEAQNKSLLESAMTSAAYEVISNLTILEGIEISHFSPRFKTSAVVDLRLLPPDYNMYERKRMYEQEGVLPELKFFRKHNQDNSINIFKIDRNYNEIN